MSVRMVPGAVLGSLLAVPAFVLLSAAPAHAHNTLQQSAPAAGSTVATAPGQVRLTFNQTVLAIGSDMKVTGPDGDVQDGKPAVVDNTVTQALRAGAPAGNYTVAWRVTSADGHPISDTFTFVATKAAKGSSTGAAPTSSASPATSTSPVAAADGGEDEDTTSWTQILIGGALGTLAGIGYVFFRRSRAKRAADDTGSDDTGTSS